ncbi:hypothetical protein [Henriciella marina]|uniref:hypothetical protein n=1 Tax=Henriciella marina TaxID=453851 RepID=UPI000362CF9C|nr:hypothetical protein [Henriciella marina]
MNAINSDTMIVGGVGLLILAALVIGFVLWRVRSGRKPVNGTAFKLVGDEFRFMLHQAIGEVRDLEKGWIQQPDGLATIKHPQFNGLSRDAEYAKQRPLDGLHAAYQNMEASKEEVRAALSGNGDRSAAVDGYKQSTIGAIAALYLWEKQDGRSPENTPTTRSAFVRDWMKENDISQALIPGIALRDEVVEYLRQAGMTLTPKPMAMTAYEYYGRASGDTGMVAAGTPDEAVADDVPIVPPPPETPVAIEEEAPAPVEAESETAADPVQEAPADAESGPEVGPAEEEPQSQGAVAADPPYPHNPGERAAPVTVAQIAGSGDPPPPSRRRMRRRR